MGKSRQNKFATKKYVKSLLKEDQEMKVLVDNLFHQATPDVTGTVLSRSMTDCTRGNDPNDREGDEIIMKKFSIKGAFTAGLSSAAVQLVRLIIYIPVDPTAALSGLAIDDTIVPNTATVYKDQLYVVRNNGGPAGVTWSWEKKFNKKVTFSGAGASTQIAGNLRIYIVSDTLAASNPPLTTFHSHLEYVG